MIRGKTIGVILAAMIVLSAVICFLLPVRTAPLAITVPFDETMYPPDIAPALFAWEDSLSGADRWRVTIGFSGGGEPVTATVDSMSWIPDAAAWEDIKSCTIENRNIHCPGIPFGIRRIHRDEKYAIIARPPITDRVRQDMSENVVLSLRQSADLLDGDEFIEDPRGGNKFTYDLYRIPFNGGRGGTPEPIPGASGNGKSNYFAKYSPDGKWIVFCQATSFMLLQPDSKLCIMPADFSSPPRELRHNTSRMNS